MENMFLPLSVCWLVSLSAGLHTNYRTDSTQFGNLFNIICSSLLPAHVPLNRNCPSCCVFSSADSSVSC